MSISENTPAARPAPFPAPTEDTVDVIVVGAGPAGEVAAGRVRDRGLTCLIVEKHLVGGECSFYACSPSKALLRPIHATHASNRVRGSEGAHVVTSEVLARRDSWINNLDDSGMLPWLEARDIALVRGAATLTGERTVEVDGRSFTARHAVILATGSEPLVPPIPGLREAVPWTNREATTSKVLPRRLAVLGGGVVACEMAQVYQALGSQVSVIELEDRLLARYEPFAGEMVAESLLAQGVEVHLGHQATAVSREPDRGIVTVTLDDGTEVVADELLVAIGRSPATGGLGLEAVGAETYGPGYVRVSPTMEVQGLGEGTPWLYCVGDLNGISLLTHMGKYQARAAVDLLAARAKGEADGLRSMVPDATDAGSPGVIFTDPEVASTGLTAAQAKDRGLRVRVVDVPMDAAAGSGLQADGYQGRARMVVDEDARVIVGVTFVGQDTAELVHTATVAVVGKVPLDTLWHAIPSFPTMSEIWLRLLEEYGL